MTGRWKPVKWSKTRFEKEVKGGKLRLHRVANDRNRYQGWFVAEGTHLPIHITANYCFDGDSESPKKIRRMKRLTTLYFKLLLEAMEKCRD